ncbi:hypothetical protein J2X31_001420 [Flavobacterium arsenatis]|uniref:Uncharacterized protein n=1 Tax=Flavobacterium arsenatis TaxID=1484332 RepID=A0ABU1TN63_9FLAO|nr:hypothetical protein [Flavobacterium arsenatis]MDR6967409.1 hypothetical protein [Flavobacterium arsenatis]
MKHLEQIEDWIENIEGSDLKPRIKNQTVNNLIDIWKFITYYDETISLKSENVITFENKNGIQEDISLTVKDLVLKPSNVIRNVLLETELELGKYGSNYNGKYNIQFQRFEQNFCSQKIVSLKEEILSIVKGEMISFEHIEYIHKNTSDKIEILNTNLKVVECKKNSIQKALDKASISDTSKKQWLLLVLDHLKNNCNTFLIQDQIKDTAFTSKFDKVFLFDFYKGQFIELKLEN